MKTPMKIRKRFMDAISYLMRIDYGLGAFSAGILAKLYEMAFVKNGIGEKPKLIYGFEFIVYITILLYIIKGS